MATLDPLAVSDLPPDLVQAVARDARADADHVGLFLREIGIAATPQKPRRLPAAFLLDLGAALRLLSWEQAGLDLRGVAGLPPARQALLAVLRAAASHGGAGPGAPPGSLSSLVVAAFADHFAWNARVELDAEVVLGEADEEAALAALADFLWEHRPR